MSRSLPLPVAHEVTIPADLPDLPGTLSRKQRVEIALDVIATLKSRQRKLRLASAYFDPHDAEIPLSGQLHSARIKGTCLVCARGMLFIKSVDRFDNFDLKKEVNVYGSDVKLRTADEWGEAQAELIEDIFEDRTLYGAARRFYEQHRDPSGSRVGLLVAICENIAAHHGELVP